MKRGATVTRTPELSALLGEYHTFSKVSKAIFPGKFFPHPIDFVSVRAVTGAVSFPLAKLDNHFAMRSPNQVANCD
jgi:hypothetical protein